MHSNRVLEIGAGQGRRFNFGPDYVHFTSDINRHNLISSIRPGKVQADARALPFPNESLAIVLARNVFGDPNLGKKTQELKAVVSAPREVQKEALRIYEADVLAVKLAITKEALRALRPGGFVQIVEQTSPEHAGTYFEALSTELPDDVVLRQGPATISEGYEKYLTQVASFGGEPRLWTIQKQ